MRNEESNEIMQSMIFLSRQHPLLVNPIPALAKQLLRITSVGDVYGLGIGPGKYSQSGFKVAFHLPCSSAGSEQILENQVPSYYTKYSCGLIGTVKIAPCSVDSRYPWRHPSKPYTTCKGRDCSSALHPVFLHRWGGKLGPIGWTIYHCSKIIRKNNSGNWLSHQCHLRRLLGTLHITRKVKKKKSTHFCQLYFQKSILFKHALTYYRHKYMHSDK